jgi:signal transduction histidine kinase
MASMKLLYKITIATFCIVFATAIILSSYSFYVQRTLINSQLEKKGQVLASVLSASVINHLLSYDFYTIKLLFEPLKQDSDILSVSLIGPDGFIKMHSDIKRLGEVSEYKYSDEDFRNGKVIIREISDSSSKRYLFFSPVEIDHNRAGVIQITLSDHESLLLIKSFGKKMLLITAAVLIFAILVGYFISRQISNPLIDLAEEMKRFMMKRPDFQEGQNSSNEIIVLKKTFKTMMSELQHAIEFRVQNEKMAVLGNLSAVLAHEVKNPLEPIKGSAEILKLKHPDNPDILKYTKIIQSEVSELIFFLDSFLDVAKTNNISMKAVDINKAMNDILFLLEYTFRKEDIDTQVRLSENLPRVKGNSGMIKQVFLNLLINAIQAKNESHGLIEICTESTKGIVAVRIRDYGSGIEESIRDQIFHPFFTTKEGGSGIGLSTSRHLIEQHNGSIILESDLNRWTEMIINLPILKGDRIYG